MITLESPRILRYILLLVAVGVLCLGEVPPVTATFIVSGQSFHPAPPVTPGTLENATITYAMIPTGATTFSRTHSLQMQTSLWEAHWIIQVFVNGIPQANQTATGSAAFMSGYLLSYPTTDDVSFNVSLTGTIPLGEGTNVTLLQVNEIDTTGGTAPLGSSTVSLPLVVTSTAGSSTPLPETATASPEAPASPSPTQAGSDFVFIGVTASLVAMVAFGYSRSRR